MSSPRKPFYEIALESFGLLTQNFVLTYPLLLFFLLLSVIMPTTYEPTLNEARWWILGGGIFLIYCAVMAGSFNMIATGVRLHYQRLANPPIPENAESIEDIEIPNPFEDFVVLLREFFPGVSQYFLNFVLGTLLYVGVLGLIYWLFSQSVEQMGGYPAIFRKMAELQQSTATEAEVQAVDIQAMMTSLSAADKQYLSQFTGLLLMFMSVYGLFHFFTIFWQPFIVLKDKPFWSAYWQSIRQCFTRPIVIIAIALLYVGLVMALSLLPQLGGTIFLALWHFLSILLNIYFGVVTVMVVADGMDIAATAASKQTENTLDKIG